MICNQCPRRCSVNREQSKGICGTPNDFKLARAALHFWEEPCISGTRGSGTVFFSGCNLKCVYCQNYGVSHCCEGKVISDERLIEIFDELVAQGAHNINLVTPSHYALRLAKVLQKHKPAVPVVYNTSGYDSVENLKALNGLIDVYLTDLKYISPERAQKYSKAGDYFDVCSIAIDEMKRQKPVDVFNEAGMMLKGIIIRHLVLPKNTNQSIKILDYIAEHYGTKTHVSLMAQYTPCGNILAFHELQRSVTRREYEKVVNHAIELGFDNLFTQELNSADADFIPQFDLTGV